MVRNIEILAYISQNPGNNARTVAEFFNITPIRANMTLVKWWKRETMKRLYEIDKGITYYITKWGQRYLNDQWINKMGDTPILNYYDGGEGRKKSVGLSEMGIQDRERALLRDEEGRLYYEAVLDKREGGRMVFVTQFNFYNKTRWSVVIDWILENYGPGEYFVKYGDQIERLNVK